MRVCIDPGHGGTDPGAIANSIIEKEVNLKVALLVKQMLKTHSIEVVITRTVDEYVTHTERATKANQAKADLFISIHHNAAPSVAARGLEIYHSVLGGEGKRLAEFVHQRYQALIPELPTRGIRTRIRDDGSDYYAVIRLTAMPAIIIEGGFLTNAEDAKLIKQKHFQERQAQAISRGVVLWGGGSIMPEAPEWKKEGLKWLEENRFITPGRWQAEDKLDMGTFGVILSRLIITERRGEK